eukprot:1394268-Amorphochlora_amoeboformis.AAC.1
MSWKKWRNIGSPRLVFLPFPGIRGNFMRPGAQSTSNIFARTSGTLMLYTSSGMGIKQRSIFRRGVTNTI